MTHKFCAYSEYVDNQIKSVLYFRYIITKQFCQMLNFLYPFVMTKLVYFYFYINLIFVTYFYS